uniref:Uncharacterized protein n=1 Tax=Desertifilum tharense IPPAS B-1220 TaxID=1781255 RepID=A0ACD5GQV6_9CYAN
MNRMSESCKNCTFHLRDRTGKTTDLFRIFSENFLNRYLEKPQFPGRMTLILSLLKKLDSPERVALREIADRWRSQFQRFLKDRAKDVTFTDAIGHK